jgi:Winged helix DNA-binding domain
MSASPAVRLRFPPEPGVNGQVASSARVPRSGPPPVHLHHLGFDQVQAGEPAVVEGVRGEWRVDPSQLGQPFSGRAALLSPFDRLIHDRKRATDLFGFDYQLEMYKPAAKRQWGVLRAAGPVRRPAGGQAGRHRRPQDRDAPGERGSPGRAVHEADDHGGRPGDRRPGPLAQAGSRDARSCCGAASPCMTSASASRAGSASVSDAT